MSETEAAIRVMITRIPYEFKEIRVEGSIKTAVPPQDSQQHYSR